MKKRLVALLLCILAIASMVISPVTLTAVSAADPGLGVDGNHIQIDGKNVDRPLFGVCDTTVLQFAIMSWIDGETAYAGKNQIFPNFGGTVPCSNEAELWGKYFSLAEHYGLDLVRIGAADKWGTDLQYNAWLNHHEAYIALLLNMSRYADAHGVKVILVLAGTQDYPAPYFGASDNSFSITSQAYANYIAYARDTMTCLANATGIGIIDMCNEPDHNLAYSKYWSTNGGKAAYFTWACDIANKTSAYNFHPRLIGVAGLGDMFGWGQSDFNLATGNVPFELNDRHYYAKIDHAYLFTDPESWSQETGKPLVWTELGNNSNYPEMRWPFAEQQIAAAGGQAYVAMTLLGTANYPYAGEIADTTIFPEEPETPVDPGNGTGPGTGSGTDHSGSSTTKASSRYSWSATTVRTGSGTSPALMAIPIIGAALIVGTMVGPKPRKKKRRRARRRRR